MDIKIREIRLSLFALKKEYKRAIDEVIPEIFGRLEYLESFEKRIELLEKDLEELKSSLSYGLDDEMELPEEFDFEQSKKEILEDNKKDKEFSEPVFNGIQVETAKKETPALLIFVLNWLKSFFGPLQILAKSFTDFYKHYKSLGKGPVFLMTLTGIMALILGFGYLIQYSFTNFFNEWAKTFTVFLSGFGIIYGGGAIYNKKEDMKDYASALIGLGVIINYLGIYAAGVHYNLTDSFFAFILLILNTLLAFFLSIHFTTRVVSFLAMTGGIFFPLAIGSNTGASNIYLSYLFFLCFLTIFTAYKIEWKLLSYLTIILSLFMVEATVEKGYFQLFMVHLFFYLYFYFLLFEGKKLKNILLKKEILVLSALFLFFTELTISLAYSKESSGYVFLGNASIFAALFFRFIKENIKSFFIIFSGLFTCIAILNLASYNFAGTIWGLEALILIYAGFKFNERLVRKEGYFIFAVSILGIFYTIIKSLAFSNNFEVSLSFINLFFAGAYLFALRFFMEKNSEKLDGVELKILKFIYNLVFVWLSSTYFYALYNFVPDYLLVLGVLPIPYYIYRSGKRGLVFGEFFGFLHLVFPLLQFLVAGFNVNSFIFIDLDVLGRVSQIEILFSFIVIFHIYKRFNKEGSLYKLSFYLRYLFFIILPLGFIPSIYKYYFSYLPIVLWGSAIIALFLYLYLKKLFMLYELEMISIAAFIFSCFHSFFYLVSLLGNYSIFALENPKNLILFNSIVFGIPIGGVFLFGILYFTRGFKKETYEKEPFKRLYLSAFIYLGYALFLYSSILAKNIYAGLLTSVLYSLYISFKRPVKPWFLPTYRWFFNAAFFILGIMSFALVIDADKTSLLYFLMALVTTGVLIHMERYFLYDKESAFKEKKIIYSLFNIMVTLSFIISLKSFNVDIQGPYLTILMVIQATILLFGTLKPVYKDCIKIPIVIFASAFIKLVLFDLSGLSIMGKIISFMGIGVVLIAGAYQFQKLRIKYGE